MTSNHHDSVPDEQAIAKLPSGGSESFHKANPLNPPVDHGSWRSGWTFKKTLSPESVLPTITAIIGAVVLYFAISRYEVERIKADTALLRASIEKIQPEIKKIIEETDYTNRQKDQLPDQLRKIIAETDNSRANTDWIKGQLANLQATSADIIARTRVQSAGELNEIILSVRPIVEIAPSAPVLKNDYEIVISPTIKNIGKNMVHVDEASVEISNITKDTTVLRPGIDYEITNSVEVGNLMPAQTSYEGMNFKFKNRVRGNRLKIILKYEVETDQRSVRILTEAISNQEIKNDLNSLSSHTSTWVYDSSF